jgi:hypothetical protein
MYYLSNWCGFEPAYNTQVYGGIYFSLFSRTYEHVRVGVCLGGMFFYTLRPIFALFIPPSRQSASAPGTLLSSHLIDWFGLR